MKTILTWLSDVYQRYGWVAVLVCIVVIVALVVGVSLALHIDVAALPEVAGDVLSMVEMQAPAIIESVERFLDRQYEKRHAQAEPKRIPAWDILFSVFVLIAAALAGIMVGLWLR